MHGKIHNEGPCGLEKQGGPETSYPARSETGGEDLYPEGIRAEGI